MAIVGSKHSGKTTTIEALTRELIKKGYRIVAVKHISERDFTIDTANKDTWRYAQAGAQTIIGIAPNEVVTMEKNSRNFSLEEIMKRCEGHDIAFLEGFKKLVSKEKSIPKIVVTKSTEEAMEALRNYEPIIVFTGPYSTVNMSLDIPYANALKQPERLAAIVEKNIRKNEKSSA